MKNIGNLFVRLFVISLLTFLYFSTIVSLFGAGAALFFTAPAPAPGKPFRRLRLRLRPKCVGSVGSASLNETIIIKLCIGEVGGAPTPSGFGTLKRVWHVFSGKVTDLVDTLNNFEQNLVQCFFCFRAVNLWEKILKDITFLGVTPTVG